MAERPRVLLTGGTGFVGRAIVPPLLEAGVDLHIVSRAAPPPPDGVVQHVADLLDETAARALLRDVRPALLIHSAWTVEHGRFWTAPENAAWLDASTALARHFVEGGGRRILGLGTCAEYAPTAAGDGAPWPETRPAAPATPYGAAKAALAARLSMLPASTAWARLFHLFGEGEHPARLVPHVARALIAGRPAETGAGHAVRDYASTRIIGRALAALALSRVAGPVNVAAGEARPMREVVTAVARLIGRPDLLRLGARPDPPDEVPYMVADISRLRREVGFAEHADLESDLARLVAVLRAQG
jgi:nucleoside-diphosphate-sugar epimerase